MRETRVKISREWATPVTIGAFGLMSVTGLLMFFHADRGMNKLAHEWVGLVMVAGVAAHATANWVAFKRYFLSGRLSRGVIALSALVLAGSFFSLGARSASPPMMAMRAVLNAPLARVAPLAGRTTEQAIADLAKAGIQATADASIAKATAQDRELQAKAIAALFGGSR
jgi:hypothetical protein